MTPGPMDATDPSPSPPTAENCQAPREILARVGDKWSVLIVLTLDAEPLRFNQLRRSVEGISQRMLTLTLRGLERDGLVERTPFPTVPPRVDYALTRLGRSLSAPVRALGAWAQVNQGRIRAARTAFDRQGLERDGLERDRLAPPSASGSSGPS